MKKILFCLTFALFGTLSASAEQAKLFNGESYSCYRPFNDRMGNAANAISVSTGNAFISGLQSCKMSCLHCEVVSVTTSDDDDTYPEGRPIADGYTYAYNGVGDCASNEAKYGAGLGKKTRITFSGSDCE